MVLYKIDQVLQTELCKIHAGRREIRIFDATKVCMGKPTMSGYGVDAVHPAQRTQ